MPSHVISDVHEWMNETGICPDLLSGELNIRGTGLTRNSGERRPFKALLQSDIADLNLWCR